MTGCFRVVADLEEGAKTVFQADTLQAALWGASVELVQPDAPFSAVRVLCYDTELRTVTADDARNWGRLSRAH